MPDIDRAAGNLAFHTTPWADAFLKKIRGCSESILIACPYIKLNVTRMILKSINPVRDKDLSIRVLTRLNLTDCRSFVHDVEALQLLLSKPLGDRVDIEVRTDNSLHAKLYLFDGKESVVTSSNLTLNGLTRNNEVAVAITQSDIVRMATSHFWEIFESGDPLGKERLANFVVKLRNDFKSPELGEIEGDDKEGMLPSIVQRIDETTSVHVRSEYSEGVVANTLKNNEGLLGDKTASQVMSSETQETTKGITCTNIESGEGAGNQEQEVAEDQGNADLIDSKLNATIEEMMSSEANWISLTETSGSINEIDEHEFFKGMTKRFQYLFSVSPSNLNEIGSVYFHASGSVHSNVVKLDKEYAESLQSYGKAVLDLFVRRQVALMSTDAASIDSMKSKSEYVLSSGYICRRLNSLNLLPLIVGESLSLDRKNNVRLMQKVQYRLIGYLFSKLQWEQLYDYLDYMLKIADEFPREHYNANWKSQIQVLAHRLYRDDIVYKVLSESGPDHRKVFTVGVCLASSGKMLAAKSGTSLREAEANSALAACRLLDVPCSNAQKVKQTVEPPDWLEKNISSEGSEILYSISGVDLCDGSVRAVLTPPSVRGFGRIQKQRDRFVFVGSALRALCALKIFGAANADTQLRGAGNSNKVVAKKIRDSPLGKWFQGHANSFLFNQQAEDKPLLASFHALLGAVFSATGTIDQCLPLCRSVMLPKKDVESSVQKFEVSGALQRRVQEVIRTQSDPLKFVVTKISDQKSNAQIQCKVYLLQQEIGKGVGANKKEARRLASKCAMENPVLDQILSNWGDGKSAA